ncbi:hypothetical protein LJC27_06945 [Christensenellaceae bacterium OttesenSCG-928-M15]|nr:hypothetical protein [Christensenellaceae bacterium OttesenSCG-928-M15]
MNQGCVIKHCVGEQAALRYQTCVLDGGGIIHVTTQKRIAPEAYARLKMAMEEELRMEDAEAAFFVIVLFEDGEAYSQEIVR